MVKKILCKHFSENDKKTVTIGSFINKSLYYMLYSIIYLLRDIERLIALLFGTIIAIMISTQFVSKYETNAHVIFIGFIKGWVIEIMLLIILYSLYKIFMVISKIEITRCNR